MLRSPVRVLALIALVLTALTGATSLGAKQKPPKTQKEAVAGELIVRFAPGVSAEERREALQRAGLSEKKSVDRLRLKVGKTDPALL